MCARVYVFCSVVFETVQQYQKNEIAVKMNVGECVGYLVMKNEMKEVFNDINEFNEERSNILAFPILREHPKEKCVFPHFVFLCHQGPV